MKRVLIFSLAYHPVIGGAEVAMKEITDRISDIEFDMITLRFSSRHASLEKIGNINIYRIGGGLGYLSKVLFIPQAAYKAFQLKRKKEYNLYWGLMTYMSFPIAVMRFLGDKTPYIITLQDGDPLEQIFGRIRIKVFKPLLLYGIRHASIIQTISHFLTDFARAMGYGGTVEVIPNGVNGELFSSVPNPIRLASLTERIEKKPEDVFLVTASRLVKKNAVDDCIKALVHLPHHIKFLVLGIGPDQAALEALAQKLRVEERVKFLGFISYEDIPVYLHISDIFIRPSLSEGFGNSFIEAMAAGIPVIATPVGGIVDFLYDPERNPGVPPTGLFVEVRNPESIAKQVKRLTDDQVLRAVITENAKKLVKERYEWDLVTQDMKNKIFKI
jgi:glycosyltransferase involved in cell wall biosynthesis